MMIINADPAAVSGVLVSVPLPVSLSPAGNSLSGHQPLFLRHRFCGFILPWNPRL